MDRQESRASAAEPLALYLHIPFCERKCVYCDFYSIESQTSMPSFVDALCREMDAQAAQHGGREVTSVFLGGGTPSLLLPEQMEKILATLHRHWAVRRDAEITMEANPGTLTTGKLAAFRTLGINRLSIGIQSFREEELRFLGRIHDAAQAVAAVADARAAGFDNVSIDLLYALPGQTDEQWLETLRQGLALEPDHLSAYSLIVEEHTPLITLVRAGEVVPSSVDAEARMYERTMEVLGGAGYRHYEVSNYCRSGRECRHNLAYWHHQDYLGFGPSAHSFLAGADRREGRRWANVSSLTAYLGGMEQGAAPRAFEELVDTRQILSEAVFLGLRSDGLDRNRCRSLVSKKEGEAMEVLLSALVGEGLMVVEGDRARLTDAGYLLCDEIAARLLP